VRHLMDPVFERLDRRFPTENGDGSDRAISRWIDRLSETNRVLGVLLRSALIATSSAVFFLLLTLARFLLSTLFVWIVCFVISAWWFALYDSWRRRSNGKVDP
jgi:ABC-type bacteriocin/lantibiotic exporter with double-glycine peptidase domain